MTLKEKIRKNFMETVNAVIEEIKANPSSSVAHELADFLKDYGTDTASLLYCYEFITEEEHTMIVDKATMILKTVKQRRSNADLAPL